MAKEEASAEAFLYTSDIDIVVDIDQTLFPLLRSISSVPGGERVHERCPHWNSLEELCDRPLNELIKEAVQPERALGVGLYPGAKEALHSWQSLGLGVAIATHRHRSLRPETEEFLHGVGLGDFPLWVDADLQKTELLRSDGLLIDDAPHVLSSAKEEGFHAATLWHSYNSHIVDRHDLPFGKDWADLQDAVGHLLDRR